MFLINKKAGDFALVGGSKINVHNCFSQVQCLSQSCRGRCLSLHQRTQLA